MIQNNKFYQQLLEKQVWGKAQGSIWLASTLKFTRNLAKYLFPAKLDKNSQMQVSQLLLRTLDKLVSPSFPLTMKAGSASPLEKQILFENFLGHENIQQAHNGEWFAIDSTGEILVIMNFHDHIQVKTIDVAGEIDTAFNRLVKIDSELSKLLNYAFLPRFGYLTSNPFECGTGLQISLFLHVPALIHLDQLATCLNNFKDERVHAGSMQGSLNELVGDLLILNNHYTLGVTEEEILSSLKGFALKVIQEEKKATETIKISGDAACKNKISRAYALLLHSYELDTAECMAAISQCKLGLDLQWLEGTTHQALNELMFTCPRAHICSYFGGDIASDQIPIKRAQLMHEKMKNTLLTI